MISLDHNLGKSKLLVPDFIQYFPRRGDGPKSRLLARIVLKGWIVETDS